MGRTAYESISGSMTTSTDHPFADILNAGRKVVFCRTLKTADWANTTVAAGDTSRTVAVPGPPTGRPVEVYGTCQWRHILDETTLMGSAPSWRGASGPWFTDPGRTKREEQR